jgi:hypothetical protein
MRSILATYRAPNRSLRHLSDDFDDSALDPLRDFSAACRDERRALIGTSRA